MFAVSANDEVTIDPVMMASHDAITLLILARQGPEVTSVAVRNAISKTGDWRVLTVTLTPNRINVSASASVCISGLCCPLVQRQDS